MAKFTIYTDGSSKGNPGPDEFVVVLKFEDKRLEISFGDKSTTNSRKATIAAIGNELAEYYKHEGLGCCSPSIGPDGLLTRDEYPF